MKNIFGTALFGISCFGSLAHGATLEVDPVRSRIQVDGKATGHTFTGDLKKYSIVATGDTATHQPKSLRIRWDFNDLKTAEEKRDQAMIDWLGGGKPKGSFELVKSWGETPDGGIAQGTLTIHGVSTLVSFPYTVKSEGGWITLDGRVTVDYQDFKLPIIRAMALMTVDPKLVVRFHVVGRVK